MKLTLRKIKALGACKEGVNAYINAKKPNTVEETVRLCIKSNEKINMEYANWLIVKMMRKKTDKVRYAIYAASLVLHIFEEKYPDDKRPRKAIQAAKKYVKNPTQKNAADAAAADAAADDAAAYKETLTKSLKYGLKIIKGYEK